MLPAIHARLGDVHVVVSTYALCVGVGIAAALVVAVDRARRPDVVLTASALAVVAGVLAAEAWHRAAHRSDGLSSMGGIAGGLATVVVVARWMRVRPLELLDAIAPGAALGFGIGRVGCWLAGCCYGCAAGVPWAVIGVGGVARHPVQLYEALADVGVSFVAARSDATVGRATARAMLGYGAARLVVEPWRATARGVVLARGLPSVAQLCGAALMLAGLALLYAVPDARSGDGSA